MRDGAAKGKIERFFRTVRDQFHVRNLADVGNLKGQNFGIKDAPFSTDVETPLLDQQKRHFAILKVHHQQGGLCVLPGEPITISRGASRNRSRYLPN